MNDRFLSVSGNHLEMGIAQGKNFSRDIRKTFRRLLKFEGMDLIKPRWLPRIIFGYLVKREIVKKWQKNIQVIVPRQYERIQGIARGSKTSVGELLAIQALEVLADDVSLVTSGCFSAAFHSQRTTFNEPAVIKNFDYISEFYADNIVRISAPDNSFSSIELAHKQLAGSHDGMNEKGLVVTYNYGLSKEKTQARLPITLLVQEILENCSSAEEALRLIKNFRYPNAAILTLADANNHLVSVEITPEHIAERLPEDGCLINTNFFLTEKLQQYDIPHSAYYSELAPLGLRGRRIHETNELRYERAKKLISARQKLDVADFKKILSDHNNSFGSENTICRHGEFFRTQVSAIFFPKRKKVLVGFGTPCQTNYTEFTL